MQTKHKAIIAISAVLLICALLFAVKHYKDKYELEKATSGQLTVSVKRLKDDIVRSEAKYTDLKGLRAVAKDADIDLKAVEEDVKKLGATISGISRVIASSQGTSVTDVASTSTEEREEDVKTVKVECPDGNTVDCPSSDPFGYNTNKQVLELSEPFGEKKIPFGTVGFSAWKEKPWDVTTHPRNYSVTTVISMDENGRHYVHNKFIVESDGEKQSITISESKLVEVYPESEFSVNPSAYLGVHAGSYVAPLDVEATPNVQLSLFSYGKTKVNPEWSFLGLGVGYATQHDTITGVITPIQYNIGKDIPVIKNTYIGPTIGLDTNKDVSILVGVSVGL